MDEAMFYVPEPVKCDQKACDQLATSTFTFGAGFADYCRPHADAAMSARKFKFSRR